MSKQYVLEGQSCIHTSCLGGVPVGKVERNLVNVSMEMCKTTVRVFTNKAHTTAGWWPPKRKTALSSPAKFRHWCDSAPSQGSFSNAKQQAVCSLFGDRESGGKTFVCPTKPFASLFCFLLRAPSLAHLYWMLSFPSGQLAPFMDSIYEHLLSSPCFSLSLFFLWVFIV